MTAIMTGTVCRGPIWVVMTPSRISENGAATSAPGRAANIAVNASASGSPGISTWAVIPAVPPMNIITRNGPPMKPVASQSANTRIFANTTAINRPAPSAAPSSITVVSASVPVNSVSGSATPTSPNATPPIAERRIVRLPRRAASRVKTAIATTVISASAPATRPRGTAASSCQSSYLNDGTE